MFHGKDLEPIVFTGQSIRLLDLKRHIVEKKNIKTGLDFDLEITDGDSGAVYKEDDGLVPKNASVIVKRKPAAAGSGLMTKLANSSYFRGQNNAKSSDVPSSTDIIIPLRMDTEEDTSGQERSSSTAVSTYNNMDTDTSLPLSKLNSDSKEVLNNIITEDEAEMEKINAINSRSYLGSEQPQHQSFGHSQQNYSSSSHHTMSSAAGAGGQYGASSSSFAGRGGGSSSHYGQSNASYRGGRGSGRGGYTPQQGSSQVPVPPPFANYVCKRCKKSGHYIQHCPTNNDPEYDLHRQVGAGGGANTPTHTVSRAHGLPNGVRTFVPNLNGVDVSGKLIIQSKDGSGYEILAPSAEEYEELLVRGGGVGVVDATKAPPHVKCPLSSAILTDAVQLPCCAKIVSDKYISQELLKTNSKCPLCGKEGVSLEELKPVPSIRLEAEQFLSGKSASSAQLGRIDSVVPQPPPPPTAFPFNQQQQHHQQFPAPPPMGPPMMYPGANPMAPFNPFMGPPRFPHDMWMPPPVPMWDYPVHLFPPPMSKEEFLIEQRIQQERKDAWDKEGDGWLFARDRDIDARRVRDGDRDRRDRDERKERLKDRAADEERLRERESSSRKSERRDRDSAGDSRSSRGERRDDTRSGRSRERSRDRDSGRARDSESRGSRVKEDTTASSSAAAVTKSKDDISSKSKDESEARKKERSEKDSKDIKYSSRDKEEKEGKDRVRDRDTKRSTDKEGEYRKSDADTRSSTRESREERDRKERERIRERDSKRSSRDNDLRKSESESKESKSVVKKRNADEDDDRRDVKRSSRSEKDKPEKDSSRSKADADRSSKRREEKSEPSSSRRVEAVDDRGDGSRLPRPRWKMDA